MPSSVKLFLLFKIFINNSQQSFILQWFKNKIFCSVFKRILRLILFVKCGTYDHAGITVFLSVAAFYPSIGFIVGRTSVALS